MKATLIRSALSIVYVNLIPYVCRIPRGTKWVAQYLPGEGSFIPGLLFFGAFASLPAIPMIVALVWRKKLAVTFVVCASTATVLLVYWHHDYDLASDAQAAVGLVSIPVATLGITTAAGLLSAAVELLVRGRRQSTA